MRSWLLLVIVAIATAVFAFAPWVLFWSIAVLFGHDIDVTFRTWVAAWVLLILFNAPLGGGGK